MRWEIGKGCGYERAHARDDLICYEVKIWMKIMMIRSSHIGKQSEGGKRKETACSMMLRAVVKWVRMIHMMS